ncbi:MAG: hypothetical protein C5S48_08910 [Candidatus Methanogaster sp.]|nr:MAG: hypothetical protein C5S48_08910 [ANME-2 cluster archaeon]
MNQPNTSNALKEAGLEEIMSEPLVKLLPVSSRPYGDLCVY